MRSGVPLAMPHMIYRFILAAGLMGATAFSTEASAYRDPRLAFPVRPATAPASAGLAPGFDNAAPLQAILEGNQEALLQTAAAAGARVLSAWENGVRVQVSPAGLAAIMAEGDVASVRLARRFELPRGYRKLLDQSVPAIGTDRILRGSGLDSAYTGKGVIIGVVDTGIDFNHKAFLNDDGSTRLLALWDQTVELTDGSRRPEGLHYGLECDALQINDALRGDENACPSTDTEGHGTHVAGVAAGSGDDYEGVAPQSPLIVVKTDFLDGSILDGINYIFRKADAMGRPVVVNLSLGDSSGAHDGNSWFEKTLASQLTPGRIVVAGAGNEASQEGLFYTHAALQFGGGDDVRHGPIALPAGDSDGNPAYSLFFDMWDEGTTLRSFSVAALSITDDGYEAHQAPQLVAPEAEGDPLTVKILGDGKTWGYVHAASAIDPVIGRRETIILIDRCSDGPCAMGGTVDDAVKDFGQTLWSLHFDDKPAGRVDLWPVGMSALFLAPHEASVLRWGDSSVWSAGHFAFAGGDDDLTVTLPASSPEVVAVGSYVTRSSWTDASGNLQPPESLRGPDEGELSLFSSRGPTADGRIKPDITAPGEWIASAFSRDSLFTQGLEDRSNRYGVLRGTSMAAPHVAGVVALMLQRNARLTADDLLGDEGLLTRNVKTTLPPLQLPRNDWGYGVIDAPTIFSDARLTALEESDERGPAIRNFSHRTEGSVLVFEWTTDEPAATEIKVTSDDESLSHDVASFQFTHRVRLSSTSTAESRQVSIKATDMAGNRSSFSRLVEIAPGACGCMSRDGASLGDAAAMALLFLAGFVFLRRTPANRS